MPKTPSDPKPSRVETMLRELRAAEHFVATMDETAPKAMAEIGGAQALLSSAPGQSVAGQFWTVDMRGHVATWEAMALEHQAEHR